MAKGTKGFGISLENNRILYGTQNTEKHVFTGKTEDMTETVLGLVYMWFRNNMVGHEEFTITYPDEDFELVMRKKFVDVPNEAVKETENTVEVTEE